MYNSSIKYNIPELENWSGLKYKQILYDSDVDGKSSEKFKNKIINHSHLYFIVIDSNYNVFGHYHNSIVDEIGSWFKDDKSFMFTLNSNGRNGVEKFERKKVFVHAFTIKVSIIVGGLIMILVITLLMILAKLIVAFMKIFHIFLMLMNQ